MAALAIERQQEENKARLKAKEKARLKRFAYKRCLIKFASNIKLYFYIRDLHIKKTKFIALFSPFFSLIFFLAIVLSFASSKFSRLFISIARLSLTSLFISSQIFISKLAKKFYIIVNDLYRMFAEKFELINLSYRQNQFFFSSFLNIYNSTFLFAFLFAINSTKIEILTLYYNSAKRRPARLFFASSRFFVFDFPSTFRISLSTIIVLCYFCGYSTVYFVNKNIFRAKTKNKKHLRERERRLF